MFVCLFVFYPPWMFSTSCQPLDCGNWFLLDLSQLCVLGHSRSARQAEQLPLIQSSHFFCGNAFLPFCNDFFPVRTGATKGLGSPASVWWCQMAPDPLGVKCTAVYTLQLFTNCLSQQKGWQCAATSLFLQKVCAWFADWLSCQMPFGFAILSTIKDQNYPMAISVPSNKTVNHPAELHFHVLCWSCQIRVRFSSDFKHAFDLSDLWRLIDCYSDDFPLAWAANKGFGLP